MSDDILGSEANAEAYFARPKVPMASEPHKLPESAFDRLRRWPVGKVVWLTADGESPLRGRILCTPDPAKVIVELPKGEYFEFTDRSDIEIESTGRIHVH